MRGLCQRKVKPLALIAFSKYSVSVPFRGLCQRKDPRQTYENYCLLGFSPLAGIMSAESIHFIYPCLAAFSVSVPLRGLCQRKVLSSQSPIYVLVRSFQSPCGDYVSGKSAVSEQEGGIIPCFSPLAGIMSAESTSCSSPGSRFVVSVPLRGLCQRKVKAMSESIPKTVFQSPCGDYVSGKPNSFTGPIQYFACFSPLAGIMSAESHRSVNSGIYALRCFSPLAGIMSAERKCSI